MYIYSRKWRWVSMCLSLEGACLAFTKFLGWLPAPHETSCRHYLAICPTLQWIKKHVVWWHTHVLTDSGKVEAGRSEVLGHFWLWNKCEAGLNYTKCCLKKASKQTSTLKSKLPRYADTHLQSRLLERLKQEDHLKTETSRENMIAFTK